MMPSIELIATLGPACSTAPGVRALVEAGADRLRLNASHIEDDELRGLVAVAFEAGVAPERIVVDLQGGKARLEHLPEPLEVTAGEQVRLPVDSPDFLRALQPGDSVRIDDGRLALKVVSADEASFTGNVQANGRIAGRKGVALANRPLAPPEQLTPRDVGLLTASLVLGIADLAVSYATPELLRSVRQAAAETGVPTLRLHAKLEQPVALDQLQALAEEADSFWFCRGDLGAEVGLEALPRLQRRVLREAPPLRPLVMAGQVLHHLTASPRPTRSEACHVADLVWAGISGFVLSDETATGPHGPEAVRWLRKLTDAAQL
jgi:pyruvate kinase